MIAQMHRENSQGVDRINVEMILVFLPFHKSFSKGWFKFSMLLYQKGWETKHLPSTNDIPGTFWEFHLNSFDFSNNPII